MKVIRGLLAFVMIVMAIITLVVSAHYLLTRTGVVPGWELPVPQFVEENALWIALLPILFIVLIGFVWNRLKTR